MVGVEGGREKVTGPEYIFSSCEGDGGGVSEDIDGPGEGEGEGELGFLNGHFCFG